MFTSATYGELELNEIPSKILDYYNKMKKYDTNFQIVVGTDSQNFDYTKIVSVICVICEGHGGIFFYKIQNVDRITNVRQKLHTETNLSLEIANELIAQLETDEYAELFLNSTFTIHIDAGNSDKGKTKELIPELVGWVKSVGFDVEVKPDSYVASSIADKISK